MRFTTWSTLKTAFIISALALLSLIPVANADVEIVFTSPEANLTYYFGTNQRTNTIDWYIAADDINLDGVYGSIFLMDGTGTEAPYLLAPGVSLLSDTSGVVDFPSVPPGGDYYIEFNTSVGIFESGRFNLRSPPTIVPP